jgi:hypothetical protein
MQRFCILRLSYESIEGHMATREITLVLDLCKDSESLKLRQFQPCELQPSCVPWECAAIASGRSVAHEDALLIHASTQSISSHFAQKLLCPGRFSLSALREAWSTRTGHEASADLLASALKQKLHHELLEHSGHDRSADTRNWRDLISLLERNRHAAWMTSD